MMNLETYLSVCGYRIFRIYKRKTVFTPLEIKAKYTDQNTSEYAGDYKIFGCIELPNQDVLLMCKLVYVDYNDNAELKEGKSIEFIRLSDIAELYDCTDTEEFEFLKRGDSESEWLYRHYAKIYKQNV